MRQVVIALLAFLALSREPAQAAFGRQQPIYNVVDASFVPNSGREPSADAVKIAIIQAATARGWQVRDEAPGHLVATIDVRRHQAVVDINYTPRTFSITYKDSAQLLHEGDKIHRNYNKWIKLLQQDIAAKLALI